MKHNLTCRRIFPVMSRWFSLILPALLLISAVQLSAQRIEKISGSKYETETVTEEIGSAVFDNLSYTSSSYIVGTLRLISSDRTEPLISYKKIMKAGSKEQAENFADYITLSVETLENELSITARTKSRPPWSGTNYSAHIDVLIELPVNDNLKVYTRTSSYTIDVKGPFSSVDINNEFGPIEVSGITSKVKISSQNSSIKVEDCSGPVTARTSSRPVVLANIDSRLGTVKVRNSNGKITLESVRGEIDARTDFAPIQGSNIHLESGRSKLRTENANIDIEFAEIGGDLTLNNSHGKIDLIIPENTSAKYSLQVDEGGRIYTNAIPFLADVVKRTILTGSTGEGEHHIDVDMRGVGTITLAGIPGLPARPDLPESRSPEPEAPAPEAEPEGL